MKKATREMHSNNLHNKKEIFIGIGGGTGSGKTLIAQKIIEDLGPDDAVIIQQDSYYKDLSEIPKYDRDKRNFDHPEAWDWKVLKQNILDLLDEKVVEQPIYDFTTHTRSEQTKIIAPRKIIVLEGILILHDPDLRELMDVKVYVETPDDIRLIRRVKRDIKERGRTVDSVFYQYQHSVRPMHLDFVEPTKQFADIIIPEGGMNLVAVDLLKTKIASLLGI